MFIFFLFLCINSHQSRHQDVTLQLSSQPPNEIAAYQWTGSENTTQSQTQYGYNYHHIDQRTENQWMYTACADNKSSSVQSTADVYAEFTTDATAAQYRSEQTGTYFESRDNAQYSMEDAGVKSQYDSVGTSELHYPHCPSDGQHEPEHYQYDGQSFHQSSVQQESEDHARYVPEGYVHFLLSR